MTVTVTVTLARPRGAFAPKNVMVTLRKLEQDLSLKCSATKGFVLVPNPNL